MKKHRLFFSLIELLIVVAIISILASLLLPALKSARDKAHAITCLSNMKQVGFGSAQYTGDNDDWLVPNWNGKDPSEYDGDRYERHWYGLLCGLYKDPPNLVIAWNTPGPYGLTWGITGVAQPKRKGQFSCPAEPELLYWAKHKTDTHLNVFLHGGLIAKESMPGGLGRKANQIFSPSLAVSFSEGIDYNNYRVYLFGEDWNGAASGKTIQYQRHHGRASFVFADGHGGMIRESQAMSVSANGVPNRMLKAGFK